MKYGIVSALVVVSALWQTSLVNASVDHSIVYFGRLTTEQGVPLQGTHTVQVQLFSDAAQSESLWGPHTFAAVQVQDGHFYLALEAGVGGWSGILEGAAEAWLFFHVGGQPLLPGQQMLAVPYAALSADTSRLGGLDASDYALASDVAAGYLGLGGGTLSGPLVAPGGVDLGGASLTSARLQPSAIPPSACAAPNLGQVYFDTAHGTLAICTAAGWSSLAQCDPSCPAASEVPCGEPIVSECGQPCAGVGEGLHVAQCLAGISATPCETAVVDACNNACGVRGAALDSSQCAPSQTVCNAPVRDRCGNGCGSVGAFCPSAGSGGGASPGGLGSADNPAASCLAILTADNEAPSGPYWLDPDGPAGVLPFPIYCDMTSDGGGWAVVKHDWDEQTIPDFNTETPATLSFELIYDIHDRQFLALLVGATTVKQYFRKNCRDSLINQEYGTSFTAYTVPSGAKVNSTVALFGGVQTECDKNDAVFRVTEYTFVNTPNIPIRKLWGGDSGAAGEDSTYVIGPAYVR